MAARRRILFVAEAVTLAHVGRPIALAAGLDPAQHDIAFACAPRARRFIGRADWTYREIDSIPSERFLEALAQGRPVYDAETLRRYVDEDRALLDELRPDLVVGDFRLTLSISARLARVPYATITSAYWSPYAKVRFPLPEHPMTKVLGVRVSRVVFGLARPIAFAYHAMPLNRLRTAHGLPSLGPDLRRVYTDADFTLYADVPEMVPTAALPPHHAFLGPVLWSPPVDLPSWWADVPRERPMIYVTLGSSGRKDLVSSVLQATRGLGHTVVVAGAGWKPAAALPEGVFVADYLPGGEVAARAALVVCNGGSPTSQQALSAGVPVLGIASNMDQFLNMHGVQDAGAGLLVRGDQASPSALRSAMAALLTRPAHAEAARRLAAVFAGYPAPRRFAHAVDRILGGRVPPLIGAE